MQRLFQLSNHYKRVIKRFSKNSLCVLSLFDDCNGAASDQDRVFNIPTAKVKDWPIVAGRYSYCERLICFCFGS